MIKTHRFVHNLTYIVCKLNENCDTYTSPLDQTHENKLFHHSSNEVDDSKENNDTLVSSYIEISIYNITIFFLLNYIYLYNKIRI